VLLNAGGNGKDVGVKNDVFRRKTHLVDQDAVGTLANLDLARIRVGLAFFVKRHDHRSGTVAAHQCGLALELFHALFHADGVDNALALHAAQTGLDDAPFGAVNHHRHAGNVGLAGNQVQKTHHGGLAVEHGLVHVDVNHLGAVFHLLARHGQGLVKLAIQNHAGKGFGAGDVGALTHVHKRGARRLAIGGGDGANGDRLQARQQHGRNKGFRHTTHLQRTKGSGERRWDIQA
jgi:hypothetical protein